MELTTWEILDLEEPNAVLLTKLAVLEEAGVGGVANEHVGERYNVKRMEWSMC